MHLGQKLSLSLIAKFAFVIWKLKSLKAICATQLPPGDGDLHQPPMQTG